MRITLLISLAVFLLLFLGINALFLYVKMSSPNKLQAKEIKVPLNELPVFVTPKTDADKLGKGIERVYYKSSATNNDARIVEITVVFKSEILPNPLINYLYGLLRAVRYRRLEDIETFTLSISKDKKIESVSFVNWSGTYGGSQTYSKIQQVHQKRTLLIGNFELYEGVRPVLYINTWNHLFAEKNTNKEMKSVRITQYPVFEGDRNDVEKYYRRF